MVQFAFVTTLDAGVPHLLGVTDLEIFTWNGITTLYSGSETSGGLAAFTVEAGEAVSFRDQIGAAVNRGTYGLSEIEVVAVDGTPALVPAGRHDDRAAFHVLSSAGDFESVQILGGDTAVMGRIEEVETIEIEGKTFMVASRWGEEGFHTYRVRDDLTVEHKRHFTEADTATAHIDAVSAIVEIEFPTRQFFATASTVDDGVTTWWMGRYGNIKERDSLNAEEGLWISDPTELAAVEVDGDAFLVIGSAGSDSLSVAKVNKWGGLIQRDHEVDDLSTRFADLSAMETFSVADRSYVVAGGSDDGLSLFEIAPGGELLHLTSLADALDTRLSNVSAIEAAVFGTEVQIFVTSGNDAGLSQFTLDFSSLGVVEAGGRFDDTLTGGAADDMLAGYDGDDRLHGLAGDDTLIDGLGVDRLTGGAGADRFVFLEDRRLDTVTDFKTGEDKLDLSDLPMLYAMSQLKFTQKNYGVLVEYRGERLRVEAEEGQLMVGDLSPDDFIF